MVNARSTSPSTGRRQDSACAGEPVMRMSNRNSAKAATNATVGANAAEQMDRA